ncbi:MAG TPA: protein kinase [Streptosporangiaceae bacterium]|nr:protein kinase [Streptosporangiaceae bacterium]
MPKPAPLLPGDPRRLGAYELVGRIGHGGQGTVFLGRHPRGGPVAVKLLRAEWTREPVARARFAREVSAASKVAPFCTARIIDSRLDGDEPFVVSEYIDGPSLHEVVTKDGPLSGSALDRLAVGTATALSAIHQAGVIHRDFKPGNVLMGPDGPRVIDFGIARSIDTTTTVTSQLFGTPGYMAPEVVRGHPAGPPADVFAWASTITFAATGQPPFHAPNVAAIVHQLTSGEPDLGALAEPLRAVVASCLVKEPGPRPTAADLIMRLQQLYGQIGTAPLVATGWAGTGVTTRAPEQGVKNIGMGGHAGVISPPRPRASPWSTDRMAQAGAAPDFAPAPGRAPGGNGWPGQPGPAARPRPVRRGGSGWLIVLVGVVALGIVGGLVLPLLFSNSAPPGLPPPVNSAPGNTGHHARGHGTGQAPAGRPTASPSTSPARSAAAPPNTIPLRFAGTWRGRASQPGGTVPHWSAVLKLPFGARAGTFTITTMPCFATVTVVDMTQTTMLLRETVGPGSASDCAQTGFIGLDHTGLNRAVLHWDQAGDPANAATGTFVRG